MLKTALILLLITVLWSVIIAFLEGIGGLLDRIMKLIRKVSEKSSNKLRAYLGKKKFPAIPNIDPRLEHKVKVGLLEGEILRFKNYLNPEPTFNGSLPYPAWEAPKYQLPVRQHIPTKSIFIGDLQTILTPNAITIKARIQSLLSLPHDFPERSPVSPLIQPPPQPLPYKPFDIEEPSFTLPEWAGIASFLNDFVKKEYASELWKTRKARERYHELIELEQKQRKELEKEKREAESRYQSAKVRLSAAYESQLQAYTSAKTTWDKQAAEERKTFASLLEQQNQLETIEEPTKLVISNIDFPTWMPTNFELQYDGAAQTIIVEHEFPNIEDLEFTKAVHLKTGIVKKPLNQKELKTIVDFFYPALCLRIAYESARQIQSPILKAVAVNGWANYKVKSTGNAKRAYCVSMFAEIEKLKELNLAALDPVSAFSSFKGNWSRSFEFTPIAPTIRINTADPRFVDNKDVLGGLQIETNLACMDWEDFEHLCRELFEKAFAANGGIVKVTQASRDQGVDAVVFDPDPIRGGKIVIQAKRYVNTVDLSAVRDLYGTVMNEGAMKGILVTTSQYGPEAYSFIKDKPLTLISGPELLGLLDQYGYRFRIDLEEARQIMRKNQQG